MNAGIIAESKTDIQAIVSVANVMDDLTLRDCVRNAAVDAMVKLGMLDVGIAVDKVAIHIANEFERQLDGATE